MKPSLIKRISGKGLAVSWPDGLAVEIPNVQLRKSCPCAECKMARGEDTHSMPLTPKKISLAIVDHTREESLNLVEIWGVGQYAIGMRWGDGHDSGIYPFSLIRELSLQS